MRNAVEHLSKTNPTGLRTMKLSSRATDAQATIKVNGKGAELGFDPALDRSAGTVNACWQGVHSSPSRSNASLFKARE